MVLRSAPNGSFLLHRLAPLVPEISKITLQGWAQLVPDTMVHKLYLASAIWDTAKVQLAQ